MAAGAPHAATKTMGTKHRTLPRIISTWSTLLPDRCHQECVDHGCQIRSGICTVCHAKGYVTSDQVAIASNLRHHFRNKFTPPTPDFTPPQWRGIIEQYITPEGATLWRAKPSVQWTPGNAHLQPFWTMYRGAPPTHSAALHNIMAPITADEWLAEAKSMSTTAPGPSQLSYRLLHHCPQVVWDILRTICNGCLVLKDIPPVFKHTLIHPIPKTDLADTVEKLRPIALLEVGYKLLSGTLSKRIRAATAALQPPFIHPAQFGGMEGRSTTDPLFLLRLAQEDARARRCSFYSSFTDISAAYDSVQTCSKVLAYSAAGFPAAFLMFISNMDQGQTAEALTPGGGVTSIFNICQGFKQGDPLSVIGWLIFANPLAVWVESGMAPLVSAVAPHADSLRFRYSPSPDQGVLNGQTDRDDYAPCPGFRFTYSTTTLSQLLFMDDAAYIACTPTAITTMLERASRFYAFHSIWLNNIKTIATNTNYGGEPLLAPGIFTQTGLWTRVTSIPCSSPVKYLGVLTQANGKFTHQLATATAQLTRLKLQLWRQKATVGETNYVVQAKLIPALLHTLQSIPCSSAQLLVFTRGITQMHRTSCGLPRTASTHIWYTSEQSGGFGLTTLAYELAQHRVKFFLKHVNGPPSLTRSALLSGACSLALRFNTPLFEYPRWLQEPGSPRPPPLLILASLKALFELDLMLREAHPGVAFFPPPPRHNPECLSPPPPLLSSALPPAVWTESRAALCALQCYYTTDVLSPSGHHLLTWASFRAHKLTLVPKTARTLLTVREPHWYTTLNRCIPLWPPGLLATSPTTMTLAGREMLTPPSPPYPLPSGPLAPAPPIYVHSDASYTPPPRPHPGQSVLRFSHSPGRPSPLNTPR